jgi:hypothetical protein
LKNPSENGWKTPENVWKNSQKMLPVFPGFLWKIPMKYCINLSIILLDFFPQNPGKKPEKSWG